MDGFLVSAAIFGIVALAALVVVIRAIINFIREGGGVKAEFESTAKSKPAPVTKPVMMAAPKKPAQEAVKPPATTAPAPQPVATAKPKEVEKEPSAVAAGQAQAGEPAKTDNTMPVAEPTKVAEVEMAEEAAVPESKYPPVQSQGPNGESEKRVAEIQDIIKKYV